MHRTLRWVSVEVVVLGWVLAGVAAGQAPRKSVDARAAHFARMKNIAASFTLLATPDQPASKVALAPEPILRYADNTRQTQESSLWIWGASGRPNAILAIEFYPRQPRGLPWLFEVASLSMRPIAVERGETLSWVGKEPGLKFESFTDADPPAARPPGRLVQMKALRNRFTAFERASIEGRIELRPLASPLHRYEDAANGIVDGAIFSFANGTNPEVLLVLEAHKKDGHANWVYGLVQLTGEAVTAQLDGKNIWQQGEAVPPTVRGNYVNGWMSDGLPVETSP